MSDLVITEIESESEEFQNFMSQWGEEIEQIFPHYSEEDASYGEILMLNSGGKNIGVFIYQFKGDELHVDVDYVIPDARDIGIGQKFFQQKIDEFKNMGFATVVALTSDDDHRKYLISCGFQLQDKHPDWYELTLS